MNFRDILLLIASAVLLTVVAYVVPVRAQDGSTVFINEYAYGFDWVSDEMVHDFPRHVTKLTRMASPFQRTNILAQQRINGICWITCWF